MFLNEFGRNLANYGWIFRVERERLAWLAKLIQQASQLPIKGMLRPQALIFFIFLSQIERKTVLRVRKKRKEKFQEK